MTAAGPVYLGQALTARELEVLRLLASGRDTAGIARELHLSPHTVKTHIGRLLGKLGGATRAHGVALGYERELLRPGAAR